MSLFPYQVCGQPGDSCGSCGGAGCGYCGGLGCEGAKPVSQQALDRAREAEGLLKGKEDEAGSVLEEVCTQLRSVRFKGILPDFK